MLIEALETQLDTCGAAVEFGYSEADVIYISRYTAICGRLAERILKIGCLNHPVCKEHADLEWFLRAILAWKEVPDA